MVGRYKRERILKDFRTFKFSNFELCKKHDITLKELEELEDRPSFRKVVIDGVEYKRCKNCKVWRDLSFFYFKGKSYTGKSTKQTYCKFCQRIKVKNYKIINKTIVQDKIKQYQKTFYDKNKEAILSKRRKENLTPEQLEKKRIYWKNYKRKNKDKIKQKHIGK